MSYRIVRFFQDSEAPDHRRVVETGLTLEEAQAHCQDPETSSATTTVPRRKEWTHKWGPWFDGYEEEV